MQLFQRRAGKPRKVTTSFYGFVVSLLWALSLFIPTKAFAAGETIAVSPPLGPAGRTVTVIGAGWQEHGSRGLDVPLWIGFANQVADALPDADGRFVISFILPLSTPQGDLTISAIIGNGGSVDANYTVSNIQPPNCLDAYFIGVHGTNENTGSSLIDEMWKIIDAHRPANRTARYISLSYHAPDFKSWTDPANAIGPSEAGGVNALGPVIRKENSGILKNCPTQSIILVGYSLGAWIINDWLSKNSDLWPNIIAVELFGDPLWHRAGQDFSGNFLYDGLSNLIFPGPYNKVPQGPGVGISDRWQSRCLRMDAVCGEGYQAQSVTGPGLIQFEDAAFVCAAAVCMHRQYTIPNYLTPADAPTTHAALWLALKAFPPATRTFPEIRATETFREGTLVFLRIFFTNPNNVATGFGFRGVDGSSWAEENHPFSNPSYGRVSLNVSPAKLEYPFNHGCTGAGAGLKSDVQVWIDYNNGSQTSVPVSVHLACSAPTEEVTPFH